MTDSTRSTRRQPLPAVHAPQLKAQVDDSGELSPGDGVAGNPEGRQLDRVRQLALSKPEYGVSATGVINPIELMTNAGGGVGDVLVLTKPPGTAALATALKKDLVDAATVAVAVVPGRAGEIPGQVIGRLVEGRAGAVAVRVGPPSATAVG